MKHSPAVQLIGMIVSARKRKNLSQSELGRRLGMPQSYISRLEAGRIDLRLSSLIDIARFLELELMLVPSRMEPTVRALTGNDSTGQEATALYTLENLDGEGG
ncbi:MAG: helix-turn-helix transcriptional regulator [Candidatus Competibacteraceae bacterium]|nr:helix-turn-helix transcriptional regulator [Candidatus Competibacteraceae bacterium]